MNRPTRPASRARLAHAAMDGARVAVKLRDAAFTRAIRSGFAGLGPHTRLEWPLRLYGEHLMDIGAGVFIGANSWLQALPQHDAQIDPIICVGDGTSSQGLLVLSAVEGITVGRRVLFARNVYVADHSHAFGDREIAIRDQGVDKIARVAIGDGAWIGQNAVIMPGVQIGQNAVVGANSVVTRDVPAGGVAVGAPARVLPAR